MAPLAAAVFVLAGCADGGGPGPSRPVPVADSTLCGSAASVDRLVVHRSDAFPQNHMRFAFPAQVTVTDATTVRTVARRLCSLPDMPKGATSCPADMGIVYRLAFSAREQALPPVEVDATGCQPVRGLGPVRAASPELWSTLGQAMGLSAPSYVTFRGSGPNR